MDSTDEKVEWIVHDHPSPPTLFVIYWFPNRLLSFLSFFQEPGEAITIGRHQIGDSQEAALICADCRTSKTPLWRGGPSGPKSLCNACGIRYRKKRRELLKLNDGARNETKKGKKRCGGDDGNRSDSGGKMSVLSMLGFGPELWLKQRSLLQLRRRRRRLAEEEEAAVLLMALSSGLIYSSMREK